MEEVKEIVTEEVTEEVVEEIPTEEIMDLGVEIPEDEITEEMEGE